MKRRMSDGTVDDPSRLAILSGLPGQRLYVESCRTGVGTDRRLLHGRYVVDPYWADCAAGGELESFTSVRGLASSAHLNAQEAEIRQLEHHDLAGLLEAAFGRISAVLPGPPTTVWRLAGEQHRHKLTVLSRVLRVVLVEDVA